MLKRLRIEINGTGLHFDRDYGIHNRRGWAAVHHGAFLPPTFTTLWRALWLLTTRNRRWNKYAIT